MTDAERLQILTLAGRTVFSLGDLRRLWRLKPETSKIAAKRMTDRALLRRIARGYFALAPDYDPFELANLIISPSYVSLQSALDRHGASFQSRRAVVSVARLNYRREAAGLEFRYHAMKPDLFFNLDGVRGSGAPAMAGPERALLDCLYFGIRPEIDDAERINPAEVRRLAPLYPTAVAERAREYLPR